MFCRCSICLSRFSAAEKLKRGDIIVELNSQSFTESDLSKLTNPGTLNLGRGKQEGNVIAPSGKTVTITSRKMDADPVLITKLFERGNHKIGYLMYTNFTKTFNTSIVKAFNEFKEAGITDLILDLRYNHGGDDDASTFLCSAIVPKEKAVVGTLLSKETWNSPCQKIFESDSQYGNLLNRFFVEIQLQSGFTLPESIYLNLRRNCFCLRVHDCLP